MTPNIIILGSGMSGFGAAYRLFAEDIKPVMFDKNPYYGGQTASFRDPSGFIFDLGPHISFTQDTRIQDLFAESVSQRYETMQINPNNYWRGFWPRHPVQVHLYGLPEDVVVKVITDFVEARHLPEPEVKNYADWLLSSFGRTFAELFPMPYTRKYHLTTADNMSVDWLGPRIYRPSLEEVLRGAISPSAPHVHYVKHFRYPTGGGFVSYLKKFVPMGILRLDHELISLDPLAKRLVFSNGTSAQYDELISSLPLPEIIRLMSGVPQDIRDASQRLACSTCVLVNIGVDRSDISSAQLTYFYDEDICFTRLSFPHMFSPQNAPPGTGSIQAEVYFSEKYRPLRGAPDDWIEPVIMDLRKCRLLRDDDKVLFKSAMIVRYANIIFDLERSSAVQKVHGYLDDIGIAYCGRYGDWGYHWTDEAFKSGEAAAERTLLRVKKRTGRAKE